MMSLLTHKFTVEQYHQLGEKGILGPDSRVELIKIPLSAQSGIPEVWLVDLNHQKLEQFRQPQGSDYGRINNFKQDQGVYCEAFPDLCLDLKTIST